MATDLPSIGAPAKSALNHLGITTIEGVAEMSEKELLALHGVGPKAVGILKDALAAQGMAFRGH